MIQDASKVDFDDQRIVVRIQELDPDCASGRPYEECLTTDGNGWHVNSISELPIPGDYIGLRVDRLLSAPKEEPKFEKKGITFKVLTRLFDFQSFDKYNRVHCNIVVEPITDSSEIGLLVKD